ncbi:hypothetical protein GCM10010302_59110 [Streptomyces polychromogenes]|uniref:Uncharacterized protein n=1 Tax=Streptomyces polychromogenes TaxID=67342 RepID=A0ABN0VN07_9ACTN
MSAKTMPTRPQVPGWDTPIDVSSTHGEPSPALLARARRGWRNLGARHGVLGVDPPGHPVRWEALANKPSADLLDRARVGWERFLLTTTEAPGE